MKLIPLAFAVILSLSIIMVAVDNHNANRGGTPSAVSYESHAPITITGDIGFTGNNSSTGISWGNGTESNPYIIKGWKINAAGNATAILISASLFSTVHFKIMNCHLSNATDSDIQLRFANHGQLLNNNCTGAGKEGVLLFHCTNCILFNNICTDNVNYGIHLTDSDGTEISNNYCANNGLGGSNENSPESGILIDVYSSRNNITSNTLYHNWIGIRVASNSTLNNISYNNCSTNEEFGLRIASISKENTIWNNTFYKNNGAGSTYNPANIQASDTVGNNSWNTSGSPHGYGNWWSDWTTPDGNGDGIVDWPYNITVSTGAKDYYPLTTKPLPPFIPEFGSMVVPIGGIIFMMLFVMKKMDRRR